MQTAFSLNAEFIIVTASDNKYFCYARELIESVIACGRTDFSLGVLDLGLTQEQRSWLESRCVNVVAPITLLDLGRLSAADQKELGYLGRPFLRESFPGHLVYIWLDADTWLQKPDALDQLVAGAKAKGAAVITQKERAYRFWPWLIGWQVKHFVRGYGSWNGICLSLRAHINNGVFAMSATAPHWSHWQRHYQQAIDRTGVPAPHDQFALNAAVYLDRLPVVRLSAKLNWICDLGVPVWNEGTQKFCVPYPPFEAIAILHLAGPAKLDSFAIKTTSGQVRRGKLRYEDLTNWISKTPGELKVEPAKAAARLSA